MAENNKRNLLYFEGHSMRSLYESMDIWQSTNHKRLHSISVQVDKGNYCCIALTNPTEVVITNANGQPHVYVSRQGKLSVEM